MEQIDWRLKELVKPSKLKVGDIISYIWFNKEEAGYEHTRQLLVEYREREVCYGTTGYGMKYEFVCILLKTDSDNKRPGQTCTFEILRVAERVRDYAAAYWRIYEAAK